MFSVNIFTLCCTKCAAHATGEASFGEKLWKCYQVTWRQDSNWFWGLGDVLQFRGSGEHGNTERLKCSKHATNPQPCMIHAGRLRFQMSAYGFGCNRIGFENRPEHKINQKKKPLNSHLTGNGGVSGHSRRDVVVAVRAVEERLSPLAVDKVGLQDESRARAGDGVQGAAARRRRAIVHIETARKHRKHRDVKQTWKKVDTNKE